MGDNDKVGQWAAEAINDTGLVALVVSVGVGIGVGGWGWPEWETETKTENNSCVYKQTTTKFSYVKFYGRT